MMPDPGPVTVARRPVDAEAQRTLPPHWHPVLRRVYAARGIDHPEALDRRLEVLPDPGTMGVSRQPHGSSPMPWRRGGESCWWATSTPMVATSCAVGLRALGAMGADAVDYLVPNRFEYGYGLSPALVREAESLAPEVIVTVDNGVSSIDGVRAARERGIQVIVTDHHLPGAELPPADALVNPNCPGCGFPAKTLAGVGVIFYVMAALRRLLRARGRFPRQAPPLAALLDLVAVGTVADVVPLERINRALVHQGLARIRAGRACPGIKALLEVAGRDPGRVVAADLGFAVGPRLNAAGRLEDTPWASSAC
ncbi:MAG: DHH family phosphoesterase [Arhodomonas sp.]|nr:DHH family phosphoesterase [Arhodomonas sp.]